MINKTRFNPTLLNKNHRFLLWVLLIIVTAAILLSPVHLKYEYRPVQSPYIFDSLPFFGALYFVWIAVLLLLLLSKKDQGKANWEGVALACVFALVFLGFWAVIAPERTGDGLSNATTVKYILSGGTLAFHKNVSYLEFPGLHTLTAIVCQVTGLSIFKGITVVLVLNALLFSALLYLLFSKVLKRAHFAAFAVLLLIQGTWIITRSTFFYPGWLGLIFLTAFVVLLNRREDMLISGWQNGLLAAILIAAATMTHFITSVCFFLLLLPMYLVQKLQKVGRQSTTEIDKGGKVIVLSALVLCLAMPLAWGIFHASGTLTSVVGRIPESAQELTALPPSEAPPSASSLVQNKLYYVFNLMEANLGHNVPLWANATRWFWLIFIYALGSILAIRNIIRVRKLDSVQGKEAAGFIGIALVALVGTLLSQGGYEAQRLPMYAPLFLIPIILRFPLNFSSHTKKRIFSSLITLFFVLSFPTFLSHNNRICTDAFYPHDFAPGKFAQSAYANNNGKLTFFSAGSALGPIRYFNIDVHYRGGGLPVFAIRSENELWKDMYELITNFQNSECGLFIFSERVKTNYRHVFGISPTDARWGGLECRLQNANGIYNNGYIQIYTPSVEGT